MAISIERPSTPPPYELQANTQLLTPPSTGRFEKRVRFAVAGTPSKRRLRLQDTEEAAFAGYTDLQDSSDESQDISSVADDDDELDRSPAYSAPHTPVSPDAASDEHFNLTSSTTEATLPSPPTITTPFPFTSLPLSVRKQIYALFLTTPGVICTHQNHTAYHTSEKAFLYTQPRFLLPGIAYALALRHVSGPKTHFARLPHTNTAILAVSRDIYTEAKPILYGANTFDIVCPSPELSPPPNFAVPLFPRGCQRLVRCLSVRVRAVYALRWLVGGGGYGEVRRAYRGLERLVVVFERESAGRGAGKALAKREGERWVEYVRRLHTMLSTTLFPATTVDAAKNTIPIWIDLVVLFDNEAYTSSSTEDADPRTITLETPGNMSPTDAAEEKLRRFYLKRGLPEAFELFKKGGA